MVVKAKNKHLRVRWAISRKNWTLDTWKKFVRLSLAKTLEYTAGEGMMKRIPISCLPAEAEADIYNGLGSDIL